MTKQLREMGGLEVEVESKRLTEDRNWLGGSEIWGILGNTMGISH
jgi:hypothetical protein